MTSRQELRKKLIDDGFFSDGEELDLLMSAVDLYVTGVIGEDEEIVPYGRGHSITFNIQNSLRATQRHRAGLEGENI